MPPFLFFQNAGSGHIDPASIRATIQSCFDARQNSGLEPDACGSLEFVLRKPRQPVAEAMQAAARHARKRKATLVVIGGDGTINLGAAAALEHDLTLGIIPGGTFNFVARAHRIPEGTVAAVNNLIDEKARPTRAARLNQHVFMVNASIGLYAKLLSEREVFKQEIGRHRVVAILAAAFTAMRPHRPLELTIERDGRYRSLPASTLIVGNNRLQMELIGVSDLPDPSNETLTAALLHPVSRLGLLSMILHTWRGEIHQTPELETFPLDRLQVDVPRRRRRRITAAIDGEILRMQLPLTFSVHEKPLMLIRPVLSAPSNSAPSNSALSNDDVQPQVVAP